LLQQELRRPETLFLRTHPYKVFQGALGEGGLSQEWCPLRSREVICGTNNPKCHLLHSVPLRNDVLLEQGAKAHATDNFEFGENNSQEKHNHKGEEKRKLGRLSTEWG